MKLTKLIRHINPNSNQFKLINDEKVKNEHSYIWLWFVSYLKFHQKLIFF